MGSELTSMRIADCMDAIIDYRGKTPNKTNAGIPLITAKIIKNGRILDATEFISEEDYDSWMRRGIPQAGDVVLTTEAPLGEVAQLDTQKVALAQRVITLRGKKGILDNDYLLYLLQSHIVQHQLDGRGTGSTVKGIKQSELREIILTFPALNLQEKIAQHLKNIDKKITLNRQINQTLEQMAQTLFKSWFVDFDPVVDNALDAGFFEQDLAFSDELLRRVEVRKAVRESDNFKPLSEDIRRLFPNAFEECAEPALGLGGWMPKGWMSKSISDAIFINPKVNLAKDTVAKFVDMKALPTSGYSIEEVSEKPFSGGMKFQNNDILLARITPCLENGKTGIVDFLSENEAGFGSTEFIILRGNKNIHYSYIACLARYESFRQHVIQSMVGSSGRQRVQNGCFNDYKIAVPSGEVMNRFADIVSPSFKKLTQNTNESRSLTKLRDTLLPKLISGELSLSDIKIDIPEETLI
ncbi:TPA: restriction endonuclease subunit S [Proteus mirabilis]|uniref:restriction endonuclease subunit S n=1 Tax=Proteus mirabilis TaxID=584 RepID=UPI00162848C8|nr:restriction endonuclease subunit S [Proteus mirabilis]MBB6657652.1 restriction endonuclease subunit S [Proteus mirabilis]MBI6262308.1 restriction endonuclease subunit S [Proteus mirabilis]MBS5817113.1 restriction endonuclease subunit S [Proteus mirabilis]HBC5557273.1 restriction endonuclease subunit S [Proteus mirabilis]HCT3369844.1 restriction endonuclease subunit S [Proteus mirabilis]